MFKIYLEGKASAELDGHLAVEFHRNRVDKGDSKGLGLSN